MSTVASSGPRPHLDSARNADVPVRALTTRYVDFWLLGGASILVWMVMIAVQGFRASWAVDQQFKNLTVTTASLSLIVNYPHFLISYKLAYSRGRSFVYRNWWQLIAVPALMVGIFTVAYFNFAMPVGNLPVVAGLRSALSPWGANAGVLAGPRLGDILFTAVFNLMIFTVGWHYTKQTFGCMMVYANFDGYKMTRQQRDLTKWGLLSIWGMNFVYSNISGSESIFSNFKYHTLDLPDIAGPISLAAVGAGFLLIVYKVFYANYRDAGQVPSLNLLAPFVALYIWWLPQTRQYEFYFLLTPLFHSLQYLAFVYKMEDTRLKTVRHREVQGTAVVIGVVAAGWLFFEFLPNTVDNLLGTYNSWQMFFFFTAAMLFINIHHYFIDNVLWRFRDPEVREYLLA